MHCLKNFLCTCGLALLLFSSLHGQVQDELYHFTHLHIVPGQEQAFIMANASFAKNPPVHTVPGWTTYVFSDHTIRITVPADDLTGGDTAQLNSKVPPQTITKREEGILRYRADLSYAPAPVVGTGWQTEPAPYFEIVTYRAKPGQLEKALEMSRDLVDLLKMMNSPLAFQFWSHGPNGKRNEFEIAFPAEDADDLAERRAAHSTNRSLAVMDWEADIPIYVDKIRTVTGRYVAEMSDSARTVSRNVQR